MGVCRIGLLLLAIVATTAQTPPASPGTAATVPHDYARLCNPKNSPPLPGLALGAAAAIERSAETIGNVSLLHAVVVTPQRALGTPDMTGAILTDANPSDPHWYEATLQSTRVTKLVPLDLTPDQKNLQLLGFVRGISAFEYFNELLAADDAAADRCADAFEHEFLPVIGHELRDGVRTPGTVTPEFAAGVRRAFASFDETRGVSADAASWTRDTRKALGPEPPVTLVYRDPGLPGSQQPEIAIVKLGTSPSAYVLVGVVDGRPSIGVSPICVEGDRRCAAAYVWP